MEASAAQKEEMQVLIACIALHALCCSGNIPPEGGMDPYLLTGTPSPDWAAPKMSSAFPSPMKPFQPLYDHNGNV